MTKSIELHRRQVGTSALLLLLYIAIFAPTSTNAFTITPFSSALSSSSTSSSFTQSAKPLLSKGQKYSTNQLSSMQSGDDDDKDLSTPPAAKVIEEEEASNVPIDVPSPILLSSSMVLAIASTGAFKHTSITTFLVNYTNYRLDLK
jgi:hypothetical protein